MKEYSVREAAALIGVSPQRVRVMLDAGLLQGRKVGRAWVVSDPKRAERRSRGRPLSAGNVWALLALLAGEVPDWVDPAVRSRLRRRIHQGVAGEALRRSEPRARLHRWRILPGDIDKLVREFPLVLSGLSAGYRELDVVPIMGEVDAYVDVRHLAKIERRFKPDTAAEQPNAILRVPSHPWILKRSDKAPLAVVAADLLSSDDPRVARAARLVLESPDP